MQENNSEALYAHIFGTIDQLKDPVNPMDLERAKVLALTYQTAINLAKVATDHLKVTGGTDVKFFGDDSSIQGQSLSKTTSNGQAGRTVHKLRG